jgi:phosphoglycolate phosphatase-like HAD superfamily hydrolase
MINYVKEKPIQAVLFDLDGTLIDALERLTTSFYHAFRQLDITEPDEQTYWHAFSAYEMGRLVPAHLRDRFFSLMLDHYGDYTGDVKLIPGTVETLRFCQEQGYGMAVITSRNNPPDHVRAELEKAGIDSFINIVKTHEDVHISSVLAKEQRLLEAVKELGASPEQSLYVGDLPEDISSAQRAGLRLSVAVLTGGIRREILAGRQPDVILDSVGELPEYLTAEYAKSAEEM